MTATEDGAAGVLARPSRGAWLPWLVLVCSLVVTAFAWSDSKAEADRYLRTEFNAAIAEVRGNLDARITAYAQILHGAAALFAASDSVSRVQWNRYVSALDLDRHYPAISAIAFARVVGDGERDDFVHEMRSSGVADFSIRPSGHRDRYVVNTYAEPFVGANVKALGYDMWQDADRRETMERARTTGQPAITQRITLRVDEATNPVPAFIMYLPAYRRDQSQLYGFVLGPFRMPMLMQDLLGRNQEQVALAIHDGTDPNPGNLFYQSDAIGGPARPLLSSRQTIQIGGRTWTLDFFSRPALEARVASDRPMLVLAIGLTLALLLSGITWSLVTTRERAERIALDKTRSLRESEQKYRNIIDTTAEGYWLINAPERITVEVNAALCDMLGYPAEEIIGKSPLEFADKANQAIFVNQMARAQTVDQRHYEVVLKAKDGRDVHTHFNATAIRDSDGKLRGSFSFVTDITTQRLAELALARRTAELERSNAELEQFAHIASHDLREPLRTVSSFVGMLARRYGDCLDQDGREFIAYAKDGAERMNTLVLNLLDFSRIGRGTESPTPVALGEVVTEVRHILAGRLESAAARVVVEGELPTVMGNRMLLERLMQNLIDNGIKYNSAERPPEIRISARRESNEWIIAVADNGIGIEPEYFLRIFGIFQRLHTPDKFEGTGIGLAICKKIVEQLGGRIWVESHPGEGSTFSFALPG